MKNLKANEQDSLSWPLCDIYYDKNCKVIKSILSEYIKRQIIISISRCLDYN